MKKLIGTNLELCVGCNKCMRECPLEMANVAYQDETGAVKVSIDNKKCIACGRCIAACKHKARHYEDDTELFFKDLSKGVPISMIAAPAVRTNIPNWENLFTYLKLLGVRKIYDVSLGADICVWAHLRYIEKYKPHSIITQPCPAIVSYCEAYRPELLKNLSPVHSPMACTAVYMRKYENINDKIAALSPCIAKSNEFEAIGTIQYNVTFAKLYEYLESHNIKLPEEKTGFDHYESGLGSIFSMPGGLKENIEFFVGKALRIDKSEGEQIYKNLDIFSHTPENLLPQIYDVLNCAEGCNAGSGCMHGKSSFEIDTAMESCRRAATETRELEYYTELFQQYDNTFNHDHFIRQYRPNYLQLPKITETDIQNAFVLLDKGDPSKQNFDCGACGSDSCRSMARKIALKTNIPLNCVVKSRDEATLEHAKNLEAYEKNLEYTNCINNSFEKIKQFIDEITKNIKELDSNIHDYGEMTASIDSIASMINLIAINASIEAAHAGVHGKAFAVVAQEIRILANKSKDAVSVASSLFDLSRGAVTLTDENLKIIHDIIEAAASKSSVT